jgi:hypothetical protein
MVLKSTLNGDKIPICRVEDLEITLVGPDLPVKVRLPTKSEHIWRSLPEVRAAEVQCMQLALALLARHESEMYVTREAEKNTAYDLQTNYNQSHRSHRPSDVMKKHVEECEKIFGNNNSIKSNSRTNDDLRAVQSTERQIRSLTVVNKKQNGRQRQTFEEPTKMSSHSSHAASDILYRTAAIRSANEDRRDSSHGSHRTNLRQNSMPTSSSNVKSKTNMN